MNWFLASLIALLFWSGSDLFSKIGCCGEKDKTAHLKMVVAVGVVMGLHAAYEIFLGGVEISLHVIWTYLPVSLLYIVSMAIGYVGLRYIELSVSSPICNSSGALVAVLTVIFGGMAALREDDELRARRQEHANRKYAKSWLAIALPVGYCLLDAAGTFADSLVLQKLNEDSANVAYELTFLAAGICCLIYLLIRREKFTFKEELPKYIGATCETVGQFFYIQAIADEAHVMYSAPIIAAYCVLSTVWGRVFLREKLSWKHYLMIGLTVIGIVFLGICDV